MAENKENKENILEEANRIIHGARNEDYGHPLDDFSKTALMWKAILGDRMTPWAEITAEDVALMMICVKISRLRNTPTHRDSIVDIAGYAGTYEMVVDERTRRQLVEEELSLKKLAEEHSVPVPARTITVTADGAPKHKSGGGVGTGANHETRSQAGGYMAGER